MLCPKCKGTGFVKSKGYWAYPQKGLPHFVKGSDKKCLRCKGAGFIARVKGRNSFKGT